MPLHVIRDCPTRPTDAENRFGNFILSTVGRGINRALPGSADSREIIGLILKQSKLESFGELFNLDFRRFERWCSIGKSCWINFFL